MRHAMNYVFIKPDADTVAGRGPTRFAVGKGVVFACAEFTSCQAATDIEIHA